MFSSKLQIENNELKKLVEKKDAQLKAFTYQNIKMKNLIKTNQ